MDITAQAAPIKAQSTSVPVDHRDPNRSHFPGDIEAQPTKQPFVGEKARWIAAGILLPTAAIVTAVLVGGKVGMDMANKPVTPGVSTTSSAEVETVYVTTTVSSTSVVHVPVTPEPTTITTTSVKPVPTPLSMSTPTPTPAKPNEDPSNADPPKVEPSQSTHISEKEGCITIGNWPRQNECEAGCSNVTPKTGQTTYWQVDPARMGTRAVWACIICQKD